MNLLEQLKSIDQEKINDKDIKKEIKEAVDVYDERVPETLTNAELLLAMIKDSFPKAINGKEEKTEGETVTEAEAKKAVKTGKEIVAEIPGGETYTVENAKEIKEAVKKDHELKIEKPAKIVKKKKDKKVNQKKQTKKKWKEVENFLGKDEKLVDYKSQDIEVTQEEAIKILENRNMPSYQAMKSKEIERKDGSVFERSYLDDDEAYGRFEMDMPLYGEANDRKIYAIYSLAELVQSFNEGHNHFTATDDMIKEVAIKSLDSKGIDKVIKKKITKENKGDCDKILVDIKGLLEKHKNVKSASKAVKPAVPPKKKALSVLVKDSVVSIVRRVVSREKNSKKKVDIKKLEAAIKKGKEFLIALRKASNGISNDNDQMIQSFEKQMKEIMTSFEQKKAA